MVNAESIAKTLAGERQPQRTSTGFLTLCPCHPDDNFSLHISQTPEGKLLYHDHGGCSKETLTAWFKAHGHLSGNGDRPQAVKPRIVATYDYQDAGGKLIFQVVRREPKDFLQRRPDGKGGWIWNMKGVDRVPYRLPQVLKADTVFVVEGEKDADNLADLGLTATTNAGGASKPDQKPKWRPEYNPYFKSKANVILPDNDPPGKAHAQEVARQLHGVAASVKVIELSGLPEKGDVSDWLNTGGTKEELLALVEAAPEWEPQAGPAAPAIDESEPEKISWIGHKYFVEWGRLSLETYDRKTAIPQTCALANFQARITEEISRDDGLRSVKEFLVTGSLDTGRPLPLARIPAREFDGLAWIRREWGADASQAPGRSLGPHLVNAIQAHSQGLKRRMVYAHSGWRQIKGVWRYLHGGGAIGGGDPVEVDLGENLQLYRLPAPGGLEAAQASLNFLEIAPWEITAPLISCAYLAPFADLLKIDFSLWIYGPTGGLKSTLAALALSHFGNFSRTTLPGSWFSTANSLEKLCFTLKDSLVVIDDFMPAANSRESQKMGESAARLIYQAGNRSSRGRLAADLSARSNHYPRCLIISTGEMLLPGQRQSATARYLGIELDPKKSPIDKARLTEAQGEAHLYPAAMAAYLADVAPRLEGAQEEIRGLWEAYRKAFQSTAHLRIPEIQAWLAVGFEMFLRFQTRMGAISEAQAYEMLKQAWTVFGALGEKHSRIIEGERPTLKFMAVLQELFLQGRIYAESASMAGAPPPRDYGWDDVQPAHNAELVGWVDGETLYLMPETALRVVNEAIRRQGDFLALGRNEMLAALAREGFIVPGKDSQSGRNTHVKKIQGSSKRVICLPVNKLRHEEDEDL